MEERARKRASVNHRIIDITGNYYGFLKVVGFAYAENGRTYWLCECRCGKRVVLRKDHFAYKHSKVKSCGCWHREESSQRMNEYWKRRRADEKNDEKRSVTFEQVG